MSDRQDQGASADADRAGGPSDLGQSSLPQPEALIPCAAHTPGPWEYDPDDEVIMSSVSATIIADICVADDFPCLEEDERAKVQAECMANARLIAAAPELYAILTELDQLRADCSHDELGAIVGQRIAGFVERYRAAIAKARGEVA